MKTALAPVPGGTVVAGLAERLDSTAARWESSFGGAGYPHLIALLREAAADKRASLAQVDALRVALEPFARMAASIDDGTEEKLRCLDDMEIERAIWSVDQATVGDCRRARAALESQP